MRTRARRNRDRSEGHPSTRPLRMHLRGADRHTAHARAPPPPSHPSLSPNRLGAKGALVVTIHFTGGESGVPSPVRRSILRFPAGLGLEIPHLRSCCVARLRTQWRQRLPGAIASSGRGTRSPRSRPDPRSSPRTSPCGCSSVPSTTSSRPSRSSARATRRSTSEWCSRAQCSPTILPTGKTWCCPSPRSRPCPWSPTPRWSPCR